MTPRALLPLLLVLPLAAGAQPTSLSVLAQLDVQPLGSYSAIWGYTAPDGREYALLGVNGSNAAPAHPGGTSIIDITNPDSVRQAAFIPGPVSSWREMKTWGHHAYVVSEGGGGVQIIDLSGLPDSAWLVRSFNHVNGTRNTLRSHTVSIHDGFLYLNGCANWAPGGTLMFDLRGDPVNPVYHGEFSPEYFHDVYVLRDTLYASAIYGGGGLVIADVRSKRAPQFIAKITYPGSGTHNAWVTRGRTHVLTTDEIGTTAKDLKIWDISALPSVPAAPAATYTPAPTQIIHNVTVRGDFAYVAWYSAGIRVVNIANPAAPLDAGGYDTSPTTGGYNGVWGVYPYFPSGRVIAGDMQNGLWVFGFTGLAARRPVELLAPAPGADLTNGAPVEFRWSRTADAAADPHRYRLTITGPGLTRIVETQDTVYAQTFGAGFRSGESYTWHVSVIDEVNVTPSADTLGFTFTHTPPAPPQLLAPADGAPAATQPVPSAWRAVPHALRYHLEAGTDSSFASVLVRDTVVTDTTRQITGLPANTPVYWRVRTRDAIAWGAFGAARRFTTAPAAPLLVAPADGAAGVPPAPLLTWRTTPGAVAYDAELWADSLLVSLLAADSGRADTSWSPGELALGTRHFWRVRARAAGGPGLFGPLRRFTTTVPPPAPPALVSPADGAPDLPIPVPLLWSRRDGAVSYDVEIGQDSAFGELVRTDSLVADSVLTADLPGSLRTYHWRVRSRNPAGTGPWSAGRSFATGLQVTRSTALSEGWNLLSLPVAVSDGSAAALYPGAVSSAYEFRGTQGYVRRDTLVPGKGHWVKFGAEGLASASGTARIGDTLAVEAGWNLIGGLSEPAPADSIVTVPPGLVLTSFFGYIEGYDAVAVLEPGKGYWVKCAQPGLLVLRRGPADPPTIASER